MEKFAKEAVRICTQFWILRLRGKSLKVMECFPNFSRLWKVLENGLVLETEVECT